MQPGCINYIEMQGHKLRFFPKMDSCMTSRVEGILLEGYKDGALLLMSFPIKKHFNDLLVIAGLM